MRQVFNLLESNINTQNVQTQIAACFEQSTAQEVKDRLKSVTQEGLDMGMFGAPSYILRQEGHDDMLFFGQGLEWINFKHAIWAGHS